MSAFRWNRTEKTGLRILVALAALLWLSPAFPVPDGQPWARLGEDLAADLAQNPGALSPAEFDYLVRRQPATLHLLQVGGDGGLPRDNFPGVDVRQVDPEHLFEPFAAVCRDDHQVVFADRTGRDGGAVLGGVLYRLNGCNAMWLAPGTDGYLAWLAGQNRTAVLRPDVRPPGLALPPLAPAQAAPLAPTPVRAPTTAPVSTPAAPRPPPPPAAPRPPAPPPAEKPPSGGC